MPDSEQAWAFLRDSDLITSAGEVQAAVDRLAAEIERALGKRYPLVLAVMGGAVVFAGQILPKLHFPLDFDYVHASRYGNATRGAGIEWRVRPPDIVKGRAVLVLDDILDHGETMAAISAGCSSSARASVHCAVLVEKSLERRTHQRRLHRPADSGSLRVRLRNGCKRLLAQPPRDLAP